MSKYNFSSYSHLMGTMVMTIGSDNSGVMMGPHNTLLILAGAVHICKEYSQKMLIFTKVLIATVT